MQSYQWIEHQLDDIRQKMDESNQALVRFQRSSGITDLDEQQNTFTQRVAQLNRQLTQAEMDRVQYQSFLSKASLGARSAEHTSELQSLTKLVCRLLLCNNI